MKKNVGIFIFDDSEVMDFAGPFEVFSLTAALNDDAFFNVFTVSKTLKPVRAARGFSVNATFDFSSSPPIDILIISGGIGTIKLMYDEKALHWLEDMHRRSELTLSICSGVRLLGKLGLLEGKPYTTHHEVYDHMEEIVSSGIPQRDKRFVNAGKIYTSGGISAGIDLSFHIVEKLHGKAVAIRTAEYMEYYNSIVYPLSAPTVL